MKKTIQKPKNIEKAETTQIFQYQIPVNFILLKSNLRISLLLLLTIFTNLAKAQLIGWPVSATNSTVNTTTYTDNDRARVISFSSSSSFEISNSSLGSLSVGDNLIMIQMEGANTIVGFHERLVISSISTGATTTTITVSSTISNIGTYSITDGLQIVKIPIYNILTMQSGGMMTCHPYDPTTKTGGVLCLITNKIVFDGGGYFNVTGKGYPQTTAVSTGGVGGAAASGPSDGLGYPAVYTLPNYCISINPVTGCATASAGGSSPNNGGSPSNVSSSASTLTTSTGPLQIVMGNCGVNGSSAGDGGDGGGFGGDGGASCCIPTNSAGSGTAGTNGGNGGNAGKGGSGGGIILIKVTTIEYTSGTPTNVLRFVANGANGGRGGHAGNGGNGGLGGDGSNGCCDQNTDFPNGGHGGAGENGDPANGGDGGNGGSPGTIWIKFKLSNNTVIQSNFQATGGYVGLRGLKGISKSTQVTDVGVWNTCNPCTPGDGDGPMYICDCDMVFQILASCNIQSMNGSIIKYEDGSTHVVEYNPSNQKIIATDGINYYVCKMYDANTCNAVFNKFKPSVIVEPLGQAVNLSNITGTYIWNSTGNIPMFEWNPTDQALYDLTDPNNQACHVEPCANSTDIDLGFNSGNGDKSGSDGGDGNQGPNGTISSGLNNPNDNAWVEENAPFPNTATDGAISSNGITLYPNPAGDFLQISSQTNGEISINITTMDGQTVLSTQTTIIEGNTKISLKDLAKGVYLIQIVQNNIKTNLTFVKI